MEVRVVETIDHLLDEVLGGAVSAWGDCLGCFSRGGVGEGWLLGACVEYGLQVAVDPLVSGRHLFRAPQCHWMKLLAREFETGRQKVCRELGTELAYITS